jgi:hypothetical protein
MGVLMQYVKFWFEFVRDSWQYLEPWFQIPALIGVFYLLSTQNRLIGVWEGELRNESEYTLRATISFYRKSGETHSWIYYNGKGHQGSKTQGVDKTIQFDDSYTDTDVSTADGSASKCRWPWTSRRFVLNCQREMFGSDNEPFTIPQVKTLYKYTFALNSLMSKRLKCEVRFRNEDGIDVIIKGQFSKVR